MNTMVRMTPMTSQTMMVRIVLFTRRILPGKTPAITMGYGTASPCTFGRMGLKSTLQATGEEILFGAFIAGRIRLPHEHFHERPAQRFEVFIIPRALEDFDQERTFALQVQPGEIERELGELQRARLVRNGYSGEVRRHVRKHDVGLAPRETLRDRGATLRGGNIRLDHRHP